MSDATLHRFDPVILREYDIRGTVGVNLGAKDAYTLGRAFGTMVRRAGGMRVMVGYDGRTHSPMLEAALVEGLAKSGLVIGRIGLGPTPMLYFATTVGESVGAGVMITGSHNPPDQNGFKMLMSPKLPGGGPIYGAAIKKLADIAAAGDFVDAKGDVVRVDDVAEKYRARLLKDFTPGRPLKVVWDNGNGAAGDTLRALTAQLPGEHILLYPEIDGTFPNHHPDPTVPKNLVDLQNKVREVGADFGVAFDGDADRIGAVDGLGRLVAGDQLLAVFASDVLRDRPGATIIADVKASQVLFDAVAQMGGKPLMWKTGHSLIKVKMAETQSPLAGEMSGHVFFADRYYGYDDALYAALRLLSIIGSGTKSLADYRDALPATMATPELRFEVDEARKFAIVDAVKAALTAAGADVNDTDGVRVKTVDGWWLLRASNTQAVLVARVEARDEAGLGRLRQALVNALTAQGVTPPAF
jgi:phosphomannomutase